jgi:hypothetical protein
MLSYLRLFLGFFRAFFFKLCLDHDDDVVVCYECGFDLELGLCQCLLTKAFGDLLQSQTILRQVLIAASLVSGSRSLLSFLVL